MSSNGTEELGIRINAQGIPETTAGMALAGKSFDELGKKIDGSARSGTAFLAGLRQQVATVGKSTEDLLRYQAAQLGVGAAAAPLILQFHNQRAAQEQAAQAAREEADAQRQAASAKQAQLSAQTAFLNSLRDQAATLGKSKAEVLAYRAELLGVGQQADSYIQKIAQFDAVNNGAATSIGHVGNSTKQTAQAFRLLPAQITDVITSLASGSPVWLIAIQQGGQIKDSFGGIGPMFKEIAAAVGPLNLVLGGTAIVVGALVVAHEQGQREARGYERALIMSGNAAGTNAQQMADMAAKVSQSVGTQGKAAQALTALASTGEVAKANLAGFTEVAVRMERTLDQPLTETAQRFQELGRAPLEASVRLNRGLNYLTAATYEQIRALMAQGKEAQAGALAQQAYADAMESRTKRVAENLGTLQTAWKNVGDFAKGAWDRMLDVGREETLGAKIAKAQKQLEDLQKTKDRNPVQLKGPDIAGGSIDAQIAAQRELLDGLQEQQRLANSSNTRQAEETQAGKDALRKLERDQVEASIAIELAQARAAASQREALINRDLAIGQASASARETLTRRSMATLEDLRDRDSVSLADYYERHAGLEQQALQTQIRVVEAQISAEKRLAQSRVATIDAMLAAESKRKPESQAEAGQQEARMIELRAQRGEVAIQQESKLIELSAQRGALVGQQSAAEVAGARAVDIASQQAQDRFLSDIDQRRQALSQFSEQLRQGNAYVAVDVIADPYARATAKAKVDIDELNRYYTEQVAGLKSRMAALEIVQPDAAEAVREEIVQAEKQKADAVLLIQRRLTEDLKPEWQRMLEGWKDTTRLMREAYNEFQAGWLQTGENAWVEWVKTGQLNIASLTDFALGEAGKLVYRKTVAPAMAQAGDAVAGLLGIAKPAEEAGQAAGLAAETTARTALTTSLGAGTVAINGLNTAALSAANALALVAASSSSSGAGNFLSIMGAAFGGGAGGGTAVNGSAGTAVIPANVAHTGAIMGAGEGWTAHHPISTWSTARRLHTGGLANDEVPAVLQRGEGVFTKGQMAAMAPVSTLAKIAGSGGGGGGTVHFSPNITIDSRTDQAQIMGIVQTAMKNAQAELLDKMARGMA